MTKTVLDLFAVHRRVTALIEKEQLNRGLPLRRNYSEIRYTILDDE